MANIIKPKRSNTAAKIPTTTELISGELGVNMADRKIYINNGTAVVQVGAGNLTGLGDVAITSPANGQSLAYNSTTSKWENSTAGAGDVVGPASATDNALARFDGTTGKLIQNSVATLTDAGAMDVPNITVDYTQYDTAATVTSAVGRMSWDNGNGSLSLGLKNGNVELKLGEQEYVYCFNDTGVAITKGQVVYINGAQGNRVSVLLAIATGDATSGTTIGLVAESIAIGAEGWVQISGPIYKMNTTGLTAGAPIYLSPTVAGAYTTIKPVAPNHLVTLGFVSRVDNIVGSIFIKVDNGYELDELHNVLITTPVNGNTLVYDAVTGVWENANLTAGSGVSVTNGAGSITIANTGVLSLTGTANEIDVSASTGAVTLSLPVTINANTTGTAANVTGTVAIANGGTGQTTRQEAMDALAGATTSGQYLRGNGTDVVMAAIVAADVPTLNQNTTGTASNVTGTVAIANGGTGATTRQDAMDALAGATTAGSYLRGNGTDVVMSTIQAADVPTLNQNTTGTSSNVTGTVAIGNGGTGATTAATARTNLGATTLGSNLFTITNPTAVTFPRFNADNTVSSLDAATFRTAIGAGTSSTTGTVTSVATSGTVSGITLTGGPITSTGTVTLGGTLAVTASNFSSQTANTFLAAPNGVAGVPTFRAVAAADIPTLNQNTTGTASNVTGTVAVANGGTGSTTAAGALTNLGAYPSSNPSGYTSNTGTVTVVTGTAPVVSSGGTAPAISMAAATAAVNGYMTSTYASKLDGIAAGATNVTNTNQLTNGAGYITSSGTAANVSGTVAVANGGTGSTTAAGALTNLGAYAASNPSSYITTAGARSAVSFTAGSGAYNSTTGVFTIPTNTNQLTNGAGYITSSGTAANVSGTVAVANGGTGSTTAAGALTNLGAYAASNPNGYITNGAATAFPAGTVMMFVQTAAPTGWTKNTAHDNKALRVVSGTASSGGSVAFTTAFSSSRSTSTVSISASVGATTLSAAQMPSHAHQQNPIVGSFGGQYGLTDSSNSGSSGYQNTNGAGSSSSHDHAFNQTGHAHATDLAVQYVDVIIATKN